MTEVVRLAIVLFAILYSVSIVLTSLHFQQNVAGGGPSYEPRPPVDRDQKAPDAAESDRGGSVTDSAELESEAAAVATNDPLQQSHVKAPIAPRSRRAGGGGRFPGRGTEEYSRECGWITATPPPPDRNCTILVRQLDNGNEGISAWLMDILNGYVMARQSGCRLLLDYGPGVDVRRVMEPPFEESEGVGVGSGRDEGVYDWAVPLGFHCSKRERCYQHWREITLIGSRGKIEGMYLVSPPNYRFAYGLNPRKEDKQCKSCLYPDSAEKLQRALPGYKIESGVACAYANIFRPAPTAAEFEPRLFTEFLPALRDPDALVVSIYIRTGWADDIAKHEETKKKKGANAMDEAPMERDYRKSTRQILECAQSVEKKYFSGEIDSGGGPYSKVVWMILTDSPSVKQWALEYNDRGIDKSHGTVVNRTILVTSSRGVHTRTRRSPSTVDFAEALIDWYLIGESDLVVLNRMTFGYTASLRTARPIYTMNSRCSKKEILIHERLINRTVETA